MDFVCPKSFAYQGSGDGCQADVAPALICVFDEFTYDQRSENASRFDPMTGCAYGGMRFVIGLPIRAGVIGMCGPG